jgi:hypothetical protein
VKISLKNDKKKKFFKNYIKEVSFPQSESSHISPHSSMQTLENQKTLPKL